MPTEPALIWLLEVGKQACPALLLGGPCLSLSLNLYPFSFFRLSSFFLPTVSS